MLSAQCDAPRPQRYPNATRGTRAHYSDEQAKKSAARRVQRFDLSEYACYPVEGGAATPPPLPRRRYPSSTNNPHWQNATELYTKAADEVSELRKLVQEE